MTDERTSLSELRRLIASFVKERDWTKFHAPKNLAMALACEAAELMEHFLWVESEASREVVLDEKKRAAIVEEVADVAICLLNLCNVVGIDLSSAVEGKLADARAKYPVHLVRGKSLKYDEYG
ncbi:MAG: nucleotide pyrophosphohydrolase [Deltaproteobacteria bacterium]|nr:nucleotide pyrophosphohydrolase [Deltaproteobacteria bacterium]